MLEFTVSYDACYTLGLSYIFVKWRTAWYHHVNTISHNKVIHSGTIAVRNHVVHPLHEKVWCIFFSSSVTATKRFQWLNYGHIGSCPQGAMACMLSCISPVWLLATPWNVAYQAPLSVGYSRQEYWSGLPCPPPEGLPDPETEPVSPVSPALAGEFFSTGATWEALGVVDKMLIICFPF